jgi:hypothetical protein
MSKNYNCHVLIFAGFGDVHIIETSWLVKIKNAVSEYIPAKRLKEPMQPSGTLAVWMASEKEEFAKIIIVPALASTGVIIMPNYKNECISSDNPYYTKLLEMDSNEFTTMAIQIAQGMTFNV